jgi:hypothetical protein
MHSDSATMVEVNVNRSMRGAHDAKSQLTLTLSLILLLTFNPSCDCR